MVRVLLPFSLCTLLPRRVLLGNWASRFRGSTALVVMVEPVEDHVCLPLLCLAFYVDYPEETRRGAGMRSAPLLVVSFPRLIIAVVFHSTCQTAHLMRAYKS